MRTIELVFGRRYNPQPLGVAGENLATQLQIDCSSVIKTWPNALFAVIVKRADGQVYPAMTEMSVDHIGALHYNVTNTDTAVNGTILFEIQAFHDEALMKSWSYDFTLSKGLGSLEGAQPPEADVPWRNRIILKLTDHEGRITTLEESGVGTGDGTGTSDMLWRPTVNTSGDISWAKSTSTTIPATQNIKGTTGSTGATGLTGLTGDNGTSAYELAVQQGFIGTIDEWLESLHGKDGLDGESFDPVDVARIDVLETSLTATQEEATAKWVILNTVDSRSATNATAITDLQNAIGSISGNEYNATQYDVLPTNAGNVNSQNLQTMIDEISTSGGGTIYIPSGIYVFYGIANNTIGKRCVKWASNVSLRGDGDSTILKPTTTTAYPTPDGLDLFYFNNIADGITPYYLENCRFSDFAIDASNQSCTNYTSAGKAFMFNPIDYCHWSNITGIDTDATTFGVDCPVSCSMTNCRAINGGKAGNTNSPGASGIGIGTGFSNDESMVITGCTCSNNKRFGIFFEHQRRFNASLYQATRGKGFIVSDCIGYGNYYNFGCQQATTTTFSGCKSSYALQHGYLLNNSILCTVQNCESYNDVNTGLVILNDYNTVGNSGVSTYRDNIFKNCIVIGAPYGAKIVNGDGYVMQRSVLKDCSFINCTTNSILTSGTIESLYFDGLLYNTSNMSLGATVGTFINNAATQAILASSEADALSLSLANPNNIYFWV